MGVDFLETIVVSSETQIFESNQMNFQNSSEIFLRDGDDENSKSSEKDKENNKVNFNFQIYFYLPSMIPMIL